MSDETYQTMPDAGKTTRNLGELRWQCPHADDDTFVDLTDTPSFDTTQEAERWLRKEVEAGNLGEGRFRLVRVVVTRTVGVVTERRVTIG